MTSPAPQVKTRQVVRGLPNFRDHGRCVERPLLDLLARLQRRYGKAFASEAGLRRMIYEDTGHMPGLDTVRFALARLQAQGLLEQRWLLPGGVLPDGSTCVHGTRQVYLPQARRERRAFASSASRRSSREGITNRVQRRQLETLEQAGAAIAKKLEPHQVDAGDAYARQLEQAKRDAGELAARWALEELEQLEDEPPDE